APPESGRPRPSRYGSTAPISPERSDQPVFGCGGHEGGGAGRVDGVPGVAGDLDGGADDEGVGELEEAREVLRGRTRPDHDTGARDGVTDDLAQLRIDRVTRARARDDHRVGETSLHGVGGER